MKQKYVLLTSIAVCLLFAASTTQSAITFTENNNVTNNADMVQANKETTNITEISWVNADCFVVAFGTLKGIDYNDFFIPFVYYKLSWVMNPGSIWTLGIAGVQKIRNERYAATVDQNFFFGMVIGNLNEHVLIFGVTKAIGASAWSL